ncbi:MAG: hypothetical protein IKR04_04065 [Clostridia bacterium]|nr:hypothetical protein [Clostridia bacterium]
MIIINGELRSLSEEDISEDGSVVIPEGVKKIARFSLNIHKDIKSLQFPQSIEEVPPEEFVYLCELTKLYVPDGIKKLSIKPPVQRAVPKYDGLYPGMYFGRRLQPWEYLRLPKGFVIENPATKQEEPLEAPMLVVNIENLDRIIAENSYKGEDVIINIKNVTELSAEKLREYAKIVKIKGIQIVDPKAQGLCQETNVPYDVNTYLKCREKIDEIVDEVNPQKHEHTPDRDKRIFGAIIKKLSTITYDKVAFRKGLTSGRFVSSKNLEGGLLEGTCVCVGYSEIIRNILACCDIESKLFSGGGHCWLQVKLDGKWYNADFTFDQPKVLKGKKPKYLLKSDKDFKSHRRMIEDYKKTKRGMKEEIIAKVYKEDELEECSESVPDDELMKYIYGEERGRTSLSVIRRLVRGREVKKEE